ncbi:CoA pyrophosphatase [Marivita hallyeonensis]|uniref:NUDIX domain-containing protein n=1 Tax=Marivita hallyeonensis TaxID=996342 RepID=A0A1M5UC29_9RHOB|nr:CoA pyrophosphatase [Marivita hallyeonensis]SHH60519.1 NUDIX domain-containing protein [Marivita hallyeonensis]
MNDRDRLQAALDLKSGTSSDFDLNPNVELPVGRKLRPAGVLVPVLAHPDGARVLLTKRSSRLKHHPGQIAFPGGKQDDGDADVVDAALREATEEVGLPRSHVSVLGTLPAHETVTGFIVTPVVGWIDQTFDAVPEPGEVAEVFKVPLSHVTATAEFSIQSRRWRGTRRHYYTVPFGPYYIWGATARILRGLADRMETV